MLSIIAGAALFNYRNANTGRELSYRRWKIEVLVVHDETKNSPAHPTAKAMKCLPLWTDMEGGRLFLMKWAERSEIRTGAFQWKIRANHLNDVIRGGDLFDCLCWDGAH
jgi:hypothetical protein